MLPKLQQEQSLSTSKRIRRNGNSLAAIRPVILGLSKLLMIGILNIPFVRAAPFSYAPALFARKVIEDKPMPPDPSLWIYLGTAVALVLLGGAFAGLTIAFVHPQLLNCIVYTEIA